MVGTTARNTGKMEGCRLDDRLNTSTGSLGLNIYLLFVVSWFLHLPSRVPFLGEIRFDFVLIAILSLLALLGRQKDEHPVSLTDKLLRILIAYSIMTIPFVNWPGSVVKVGLPSLTRAIVFYYFTISFIKTSRDLKRFLFVFLACQCWRVFEPLYLHVTEGYWGDVASMDSGSEILSRLSAAPHDHLNPNGLAFIICTVFPFLYYLSGLSWKHKVVFSGLTPAFLYCLAMTGSRSGVIALAGAFIMIVVKSKNRTALVIIGVLVALVAYSALAPDMKDRYLSILGEGEKNRGTFEWRVKGVEENTRIILRRPIFGHGLGTSRETNANFWGNDQVSHNLYAEIGQELGIAGLFIFILFIGSITNNFIRASKLYRIQNAVVFLKRVVDGMQVWLIMNIIFSFASYGLHSYEWYLFGGLSVVLVRIADSNRTDEIKAGDKTNRELCK